MPRTPTIALVAAALLAAAPPASAHLGRPGYAAAVRAIAPATPGLRVAVLGGDDQLSVTNATNTTITVLGDDGEPYVRFAPSQGAVAVNLNAPSLYRDGGGLEAAAAPATATATATPRWQVVARHGTYAWHDVRIRGAAGAWTVPLRAGTRTLTVRGTLTHLASGPGGGTNPFIFLGPVVLVLAAVLLLSRHQRRTSPTTAEAW